MPSIYPTPLIAPPHVQRLLDRLHKLSLDQENAFGVNVFKTQDFDDFMKDKFIALDEDKCLFVYQLCRAIGAKNIIEAGTSFGVSTIYLALAVAQNDAEGSGRVIATENEPAKAARAREFWTEAGVNDRIELREGDLRETLKVNLPVIDLLLLDIWSPMALPTLQLVQSSLRPGAIVITDNTIGSAARYKDLLEYLRAENSGFTNMTLPFSKGLEMSVYVGTTV